MIPAIPDGETGRRIGIGRARATGRCVSDGTLWRVLALSLMGLAVSGCSSDPHAVFTTPGVITGPIYGLKGGTLTAAISYLGNPDTDARPDPDHRVLTWNGTASPDSNRTAATTCTIKATVNPAGTIESVEIDTRSAYYCPRGGQSPALRGPLG